MKHALLKFNHGVEIGAYLAYVGHFKRTNDPKVQVIANEELEHREELRLTLKYYGEVPNPVIDRFFTIVGTCIQIACKFSPRFMLNFVATSMELFAVVNYSYLSVLYNDFHYSFKRMAETEMQHQKYFSRSK